MTKTEKRFYDRYIWSVKCHGFRNLYDVYAKPSEVKEEIFKEIHQAYQENSGTHLTVTGGNCYSFSVAYLIPKDRILMYYSKEYTRRIFLTEEEFNVAMNIY